MAEKESFECCVGNFLNDNSCNLTTFSTSKVHHNISDFSKDDLEILYLRLPGIKNIQNKSVCDHHYNYYYNYYTTFQKKCCDPLQTHKKNITKNLIIISLEFCQEAKNSLRIDITPGQKICANCCTKIKNNIEAHNDLYFKHCCDPFDRHRSKIDNDLITLDEESILYLNEKLYLSIINGQKICINCDRKLKTDILDYKKNLINEENFLVVSGEACSETSEKEKNTPEFLTDSQKKKNLNEILETFDIPPLKRQKLDDGRVVEKGVEIVQNVINKTSEKFEAAHQVELPKFDLEKLRDESNWFTKILLNIQFKYNLPSTSYDEKIELLTFLPDAWSLKTVNLYFKCTRHQFDEMKKLKNSGKNQKIFCTYCIK